MHALYCLLVNLNFSAQLQSINSAILDWSTLTEYNTKEFVIERMMDSEKNLKKSELLCHRKFNQDD